MRPLLVVCLLLAACTAANPEYDPISAWIATHPDAGDPFAQKPDLASAPDLLTPPDLTPAPDLQLLPDLAIADLNKNPDLTLVCASGLADCNGNMADGCEVDTRNDPLNCGACGNQCGPFENAVAGCADSKCVIAVCADGFANCTGDIRNGCTVNIEIDPNNCGGCGRSCGPYPNAVAACVAPGRCVIASCAPGWADCDGRRDNGCEAMIGNGFCP